jgi:uncharacterized membrane protein YdjX (TVP38/TMEM64 family)
VSRALKIGLLVVAAAAVAAAIVWLPLATWLRTGVQWVRDLGPVGVVVFSLLFIIACLAMLPTIELYLAAGMLYGTLWGGTLTSALGVIAELCTLLLLRTRVRHWIEERLAHHPKLKALDKGIRDRSLSILFLLRLSPILPVGPLNYALGLTKVPLWKRIVTNFVGMLPSAFVQAYIGSFLTSFAQLQHAQTPPLWKHVVIWGGIVTTVGAGVLAARATRRALERGAH